VKIALLSYDFAEYCICIASALAQGNEVLLLLPEQLASAHIGKVASRVQLRMFHKPRLRQPWKQLRVATGLVRIIRSFNPDVVHIQQGHLWFNLLLPALRKYPLVITVHDPLCHLGDAGARKTPQQILEFGFRRAARLITHGEPLKEVLVHERGFVPAKIHCIPHVAIGETHCSGAPDSGRTVLFFGRIWPYKGLEYLIRAEPMITSQVPEAKIIIAGQGESFARYRQMMPHPERFVIRNEYISEAECSRLFQTASVVVLPYVEATQSGVVPMAYSAGKPVVATAVGGLPEVVIHGETGLLAPPRNEQALADAIVTLLRDPILRRRLGTNGQHIAQNEWSPPVVAKLTMIVYREAMDGHFAS
jgi:glycosyltransferase involved in cell wall biosynthesis